RHGGTAIGKFIGGAPHPKWKKKTGVWDPGGAGKAVFEKPATGFLGGATVEDVSLMRGVVGDRAGVKASGGIRTAATAQAMIEAGANRLGTSAGVAIVRELGAGEFPGS